MNGLLHSLDIDESLGAQMRGPMDGQLPEFEQLWKEGYAQSNMQMVPRPPMPLANQWADEFQHHAGPAGGPKGWANEFHMQQNGGPKGWADEFHMQQSGDWANQFQEVCQLKIICFGRLIFITIIH